MTQWPPAKSSSQTRAAASACLDRHPLTVPNFPQQRQVQKTRRSTRMHLLLRQPSSAAPEAELFSAFRSPPGIHPRTCRALEASSPLLRRHRRSLPQTPQILAEPPLPRRHPPGLHPARPQALMTSRRARRPLLRRANPRLTPQVLPAIAKLQRQPKAARPMIPKTPPARRKRAPGSLFPGKPPLTAC